MSFIDSMERIISEIERLVGYDENCGYLGAEDIIGRLCKQEGKTPRDFSTIFAGIFDVSLNKYVKDRKMMATYKIMIKDDDYDIQSYVECSPYDNESSFSTGFSKKFGVPPKQAWQQKDIDKIEEPISIDSIIPRSNSAEKISKASKKKFGLPKDVIDRYEVICEYKAMFGLEDLYVELAVYLNEEKGVELKDAFKTVDDFLMDYEYDIEGECLETLEELLEYVDNEVPVLYVKHLYPDVCLPQLNTWNMYLKEEGGDASEVTQEFIKVFISNVSEGLSYKDLKEFYEDYLDNYKDAYDFRGFIKMKQESATIEYDDQFIDDVDIEYWKFLNTEDF
ncbi:AraC family transcriptional regulator [Butyrivibrio fibrisolvens]|uniref:AraC family transcriptional regulator n=1 Tax=Butyrivibrio fibrisolvens TaxID=831 RepID=UPI0003B5497B|nr:AraC family transcriptional regulator [Butyrivibrio fibrisolvens]